MLRLQVNRLLALLGQLSRQGRVILRLCLQLMFQVFHVLLDCDIRQDLLRLFPSKLHIIFAEALDQFVFLQDLLLLAADFVQELSVLGIQDFVLSPVKLHQPLVVFPL